MSVSTGALFSNLSYRLLEKKESKIPASWCEVVGETGERKQEGGQVQPFECVALIFWRREICPLPQATSRFRTGPFAARCIGELGRLIGPHQRPPGTGYLQPCQNSGQLRRLGGRSTFGRPAIGDLHDLEEWRPTATPAA